MRLIGWVAFAAAACSIGSVACLVLQNDGARAQLLALHFPLDQLGENVVGMVLPLALSSAAVVLAFLAVRQPSGRWALAVATVSWVINLAVLGRSGLQFLF